MNRFDHEPCLALKIMGEFIELRDSFRKFKMTLQFIHLILKPITHRIFVHGSEFFIDSAP